MADNERRLPIRIVVPHDRDLQAPHAGGSRRKVFVAVDQSVRGLLLGQVSRVREHFRSVLDQRSAPPGVARVVLKEDALAKSHRPARLFSKDTCPIIGGETFGNLLVSVTASGLERLERDIGHSESEIVAADISTVDRIEPYTAEDAAGPLGIGGLERLLLERRPHAIKLRLFRHRDSIADDRVRAGFVELVRSLDLPAPEPLPYLANIRIYRVNGVSAQMLPQLAGFVGTQSVGVFPQFRLAAQYIPQRAATPDDLPPPEAGRSYPLVGLIDSGTDPNNPLLQAWVVDRDEEDVPRADQDHNHGSFVAGLIINGRRLNHGDSRFAQTQARIVDVVAMPKAATPVEEFELLQTIRRVVAKYPDVRVWNLSLSRADLVCRDDGFSDFGMALDELQQRHDVTFVMCAGNYAEPPLRGWPPEDLGEADRVHPPADSVLGVAVGSVAHLDHANTRVRRGEPSPFSRRGPGAAFLPKPEVCHYGGNCDANLDYRQVGVVSIDGAGQLSEAIGTSFSTPLVASLLANVRSAVVDPISRNLARALLVQSAALGAGPIVAEHLRYKGFGIPGELPDILTCAPWQATLIFELEIPPQRRIFTREDFPIPTCFRRPDGRVEGEFLMTLAYDPPLEPAAGAEYCQVNVDVSLGTYDPGADGKPVHEGKIPLEPKDYSKLYERHLVEFGFKWSPVKVYRTRLKATSGDRWRLKLRTLYRANAEPASSQNVALVVTLFDPKRRKPVYNDVVTAMARAGWVTQDLRVDERIRARGSG